jgi:hypothetical protein
MISRWTDPGRSPHPFLYFWYPRYGAGGTSLAIVSAILPSTNQQEASPGVKYSEPSVATHGCSPKKLGAGEFTNSGAGAGGGAKKSGAGASTGAGAGSSAAGSAGAPYHSFTTPWASTSVAIDGTWLWPVVHINAKTFYERGKRLSKLVLE